MRPIRKKAAVYHEFGGPIRIEDVPVPSCPTTYKYSEIAASAGQAGTTYILLLAAKLPACAIVYFSWTSKCDRAEHVDYHTISSIQQSKKPCDHAAILSLHDCRGVRRNPEHIDVDVSSGNEMEESSRLSQRRPYPQTRRYLETLLTYCILLCFATRLLLWKIPSMFERLLRLGERIHRWKCRDTG